MENIVINPKWIEVETNHGYKLKQLLGEGSFGQVYKAENTITGQQVAIKLIDEPFCQY